MEGDKKRILVIEDEEGLVYSLTTFLKGSGYEVSMAFDALFGLSSARKEKPDLIILDLGLPAGGGFSVIENLRRSVDTIDVPIIILTANPSSEAEEKAKSLGVNFYMKKPFEPPELLQKVKEILGDV